MDVFQFKYLPIMFVITLLFSTRAIANCPNELTIFPTKPNSNQIIEVTYCTTDFPDNVSHLISGNTIDVEITTTSNDFTLPSHYNLTEHIGPLPVGEYTLNVTYGNYGEKQISTILSISSYIKSIPTTSLSALIVMSIVLAIIGTFLRTTGDSPQFSWVVLLKTGVCPQITPRIMKEHRRNLVTKISVYLKQVFRHLVR